MFVTQQQTNLTAAVGTLPGVRATLSTGTAGALFRGQLAVAVQSNGHGSLHVQTSIGGYGATSANGISDPDLVSIGSLSFTTTCQRQFLVIEEPATYVWFTIDSFTRDVVPTGANNDNAFVFWFAELMN